MEARIRLDQLLTVDELAQRLSVSVKTVRNWAYKRNLPFTRLGRRIYFSTGVVEGILGRNEVPALNSFMPSPRAHGAGGATAERKQHG